MGTLVISQAGIDACADAKQGGFKLSIQFFSIGTSDIEATHANTSLLGTELYSGEVSMIEIINESMAMFTLELPIGSPVNTDSYIAKELAIYLPSGIMFARGVFSSPIIKYSNIGMRIYAFLLASVDCDLTTINVTVGTTVSIPAVASVKTLPPPSSGVHNVYSVLDLKHNSDGSDAASLSVRYGSSAKRWSFVGWDRIYSDQPTELVSTTPQKFRIPSTVTDDFLDNQLFIGQIVIGPGEGESRKLLYDKDTNVFIVQELSFSGLTLTSEIAIWKVGEGSTIVQSPESACPWPPYEEEKPPSDWVLTRGVGTCPVWAPPAVAPGSGGVGMQAGALLPYVYYFTGNGRTRIYDTLHNLNTGLVWVSLDGIVQHVDAYDLQNTKVVFSENIPAGVNVEIIVYVRDNAQVNGEVWKFNTQNFVTDGTTSWFKLTATTLTKGSLDAMKKYVSVFLSGIKQFWSAFRLEINSSNEINIVFNEAPPAALDLQITWIGVEARAGYAVTLTTNTFIGTGNQETYNLSIAPENRSNVFVSISGVSLHNIDQNFTIDGNLMTIPVALTKGLPIQVLIFSNVLTEGSANTKLTGVVTGAVSSHTYIKLLRYNAPDVQIPFQKVSLEGLDGINISGEFPNFRIKNTYAPKPKSQRITPVRYSTLHTINDSEEIIYAYKFAYDSDMIVTVTADFACRLGPGFRSEDGYEYIEYVLGFKTLTSNEAPYGRRIKGTGMAGFGYLDNGQYAYSNASVTQTYDLLIENNRLKNVTFVAKMRIKNGSVSRYQSMLDVNFSLLAIPKYGD